MPKDKRLPDIDRGMLAFGTVLGLVVGGLVTLLTAPKRGDQNRETIAAITRQARGKIEESVPSDPVEESMAVGKAAARRRREALGIGGEAND